MSHYVVKRPGTNWFLGKVKKLQWMQGIEHAAVFSDHTVPRVIPDYVDPDRRLFLRAGAWYYTRPPFDSLTADVIEVDLTEKG